MSEDLSTADKIQWLIDYEGCEQADGYEALQTFFQYCCCDDNITKILDLIEEDVDEQYVHAKEINDDMGDYKDDEAIAMVSAMWDDLIKAGFLSNLPDQYPKDAANMKEKWKEQLRVML